MTEAGERAASPSTEHQTTLREASSVPISMRWQDDSSTADLTVLEAFRWLALALLAIFLCYSVVNLPRMNDPIVRKILLFDLVPMLTLAAAQIAYVRRTFPLRWAHGTVLVVALMTALNITLTAWVKADAADLVYVPLLTIGVGSVVLSTWWWGATVVVCEAVATLATLRLVAPPQLMNHMVMTFTGMAISASVFVGRLRAFNRLQALRSADASHASALSQALAESEERRRRQQEAEEQLRQSQKLEAVGVLAGGVAHDMNNVLGSITAIASVVGGSLPPGSPIERDLDDILNAARRGSALTRNLLGFARTGTRLRERFAPDVVIESVVRLLEHTLSKQISIQTELAPELDDVVGDAGQLSHVLMNLCINAADAMAGKGLLRVVAHNVRMGGELATRLRLEEGRYIALHVIDDGCGIPPENLQRIFEPFFTTKATKERSGLGLAMVYGTVRAHGGQVAIESQLGRGTDVCVYLPSQFQNTASAVPPSVRLAEPDARRKKILLVDDEPLLRSAGRRMLRAIDYEPLVAENGEEAISLFQSHHDEIALVVLDVAMPIMGGAECFHAIRAIDPQARVLVASGYAQSGEVEELLVAGATGYLSKPYDKLDLARAVAQAVGLRPGIDHPSLEDLAATLEKG